MSAPRSIIEWVEIKLSAVLHERRLARMTRRFGGIQKCPWCRQWAQEEDFWNMSPYDKDAFLDKLTCGVCGGTSLWHWGMGMHFVRPLNPPKPAFEASEVFP